MITATIFEWYYFWYHGCKNSVRNIEFQVDPETLSHDNALITGQVLLLTDQAERM